MQTPHRVTGIITTKSFPLKAGTRENQFTRTFIIISNVKYRHTHWGLMRISIETAAVTMEVWRQRIKVISGAQDVCVRSGGWVGVSESWG